MIFLWTKSSLPFSKLIRWGLKEDCSHFSIMFFEQYGQKSIVIESRLEGVQEIRLSNFLAQHTVVHALQAPLTEIEEQVLYLYFLRKIKGKKYDSWAMAYWIYAGIMYRFFGQRLPHKNAWGENELVYCVEIMQEMREYLLEIDVDLSDFDLEMTSPHGAYKILKESEYLREVYV